MSTIPDFCCDTKCLTIKRCDGPWCLEDRCSCDSQCQRVPAKPDDADSLHKGTLTLASKRCCGTAVCGDTLTVAGAGANVSSTYKITYIGNGVIVAGDDTKAIRLEGYRGHLVHVESYNNASGVSALTQANDGLRQHAVHRVSAQRRCANSTCDAQIAALGNCSVDAPCGCPC